MTKGITVCKTKMYVQAMKRARACNDSPLERVFEEKIQKIVKINEIQMGFMPSIRIIDAIFSVRHLLEKIWEDQKVLHCI